MALTSITPDNRYRLRVEATLSPVMVKALANALDIIAERQPTIDVPERLARVIAAGCRAIFDAERKARSK